MQNHIRYLLEKKKPYIRHAAGMHNHVDDTANTLAFIL